jgi:hypothetical protein
MEFEIRIKYWISVTGIGWTCLAQLYWLHRFGMLSRELGVLLLLSASSCRFGDNASVIGIFSSQILATKNGKFSMLHSILCN